MGKGGSWRRWKGEERGEVGEVDQRRDANSRHTFTRHVAPSSVSSSASLWLAGMHVLAIMFTGYVAGHYLFARLFPHQKYMVRNRW